MNKVFLLFLFFINPLRVCFAQQGNPILIDTAKKFNISKHGYFYEDKKFKPEYRFHHKI